MSHVVNDKISLELAKTVAVQLPQRPEWIEMARANLNRWMELNKDAPGLIRLYQEWLSLLNLPVDQIVGILLGTSDESQRLRSTSPFTGALTPQQVWEIKRRIRHDETAA